MAAPSTGDAADAITPAAVRARKRPHRSQTRRQVLDAAFAVFSEHGIAASSLNQVAAAAGLTKGAVYSNFASKDDLVLALMEEHAAARTDAALAGFTSADAGDPQRALAQMAAALVHGMRADAAWHRLLAEYFAMSSHDAGRREGLRHRRREVRDAVARAVARVSQDLAINLPFAPTEMATVMLALSNGLAVEAAIDPDAVPDDLLGRVLVLIAGDSAAPG
ncbi:AcrR family transcriptional regulator [Catenulispora sp. EB89]|uniref:TetR/AcrR family transcriptional regulator n=1 Tax=Catenulispora sp. EB89 TaxID=3156257 RepID=UPI003517228F